METKRWACHFNEEQPSAVADFDLNSEAEWEKNKNGVKETLNGKWRILEGMMTFLSLY